MVVAMDLVEMMLLLPNAPVDFYDLLISPTAPSLLAPHGKPASFLVVAELAGPLVLSLASSLVPAKLV